MKKRLEAELISIAHRVLKIKNKSEVDQLYHETQKLYEALAILKFYGDNYEQIKSEVAKEDLEEKVETFVQNKTTIEIPKEKVILEENHTVIEEVSSVSEEQTVALQEKEIEEPIASKEEENPEPIQIAEEPVIVGEITIEEEIEEEEPKNDLIFEPIFELAAEAPIEDVVHDTTEEMDEEKIETPKKQTKQISFEDLLGDYAEPVFVKPNDIVIPPSLKKIIDEKPLSLNDQHSKAINIGMNDRIAFVKHLFADDNEDFNRVLSQLNTFTSYAEAKDFIEEIIKPDYNNWVGSEEYAERFLEIVENKFN